MTEIARRATAWLLFVLVGLPACGKESPTEARPPIEKTAAPAPEPLAPAPPSAEPAPPATIREALGEIAAVDLMEADEVGRQEKKLLTVSATGEVEELLRAINLDQVATGLLRRCPDQFVLVLREASGAAKGEVGLCTLGSLGPEFTPAGGVRKGITLADEDAFRRILKLPKPPPSAE